MTETMIFWADNDTQNAIELDASCVDYLDIVAQQLGCSVEEVNMCKPTEIVSYGISLKSEIFQQYPGYN